MTLREVIATQLRRGLSLYLAVWRRSPLRPLIEKAFSTVDADDIQEVATAVQEATAKISEFDEVETLETNIGELFVKMSGARQDIKPRLGFGPTESSRLYRTIRLLIDEGARSISDASLGSANLMFLTLKTLELRQMLAENKRDHTFLCIEEPRRISTLIFSGRYIVTYSRPCRTRIMRSRSF